MNLEKYLSVALFVQLRRESHHDKAHHPEIKRQSYIKFHVFFR